MKTDRSRNLPVKTLIVCITVIILAGIGSWVYVQKQNDAQRDRALKAQQLQKVQDEQDSIKKLKYQECQTNNRNITAEIDKGNTFASIGAKNCDLIL